MSSTQARNHTVLPLIDDDGYTIPFGASIKASLLLPSSEPAARQSQGHGGSRSPFPKADISESSEYNNAWDVNQLQSIIPSDPSKTAKVSSQKDDVVPCDSRDSGAKALSFLNTKPTKRRYIPLSVPESNKPEEDLQARPLPRSQSDRIDPSKILQEQPWYHEQIGRERAEEILRKHGDFSFLVRLSESCRTDYSLSIRDHYSTNPHGCIHLKIIRGDKGYVLGQFSSVFETVPECIAFYMQHKLTIKGVQHRRLGYPVPRCKIRTRI